MVKVFFCVGFILMFGLKLLYILISRFLKLLNMDNIKINVVLLIDSLKIVILVMMLIVLVDFLVKRYLCVICNGKFIEGKNKKF